MSSPATAGGPPVRAPRPRPSAADLGWHRLGQVLLVIPSAVAVASALLYSTLGLSLDWPSLPALLVLPSGAFLAWLYYCLVPGRSPREWAIAESFFVFGLLSGCAAVFPQAQYVAVALKQPLVDASLAALDARMGVDVVALTAWLRAHETLARVVIWCYFTLLVQFLMPVLVVGGFLGDRERLWEYAFHFIVCSLVTVIALAFWPALTPQSYYGFEPLISQGRVIHDVTALRGGTLTVVRLGDLEGLVCLPSFHAAGGLMVTWAFRRARWLLWPLAILNTGLIAGTFMTGAHYFVDVLAGVLMFAGSLAAYSWLRATGRVSLGART